MALHRSEQDNERQAAGHAWQETGFEFTDEHGRPLHPAAVTSTFQLIAWLAGLPPVRLHDLRHGAATLLLAAGHDMKVVQETLGLSSITIAADTYTSVLPELARKSAEDVAALIRPPAPAAGGPAPPRLRHHGETPPAHPTEGSTMTSTSPAGRPGDLAAWLTRYGFTPHPAEGTWLDHAAGQAIIRVVAEPGERTQLIALAPHGVCLYQAAFSPGTPGAVITAAIQAALAPAPPHDHPAGTRAARRGSDGQENNAETGDDDRRADHAGRRSTRRTRRQRPGPDRLLARLAASGRAGVRHHPLERRPGRVVRPRRDRRRPGTRQDLPVAGCRHPARRREPPRPAVGPITLARPHHTASPLTRTETLARARKGHARAQMRLPVEEHAALSPGVTALDSRTRFGCDMWSRPISPFLTSRRAANIRLPSKHGASTHRKPGQNGRIKNDLES